VSAGRSELARLTRFGALGAASSATSIAAYGALAPHAPLGWAWGGAYLLGILLTTALSDRVVFAVRARARVRILAFGGYVTVFLIGMSLVWVLQTRAGLAPLLAGAASVVVSAPLNYALGRRLFLQPPAGSEDEVPVDEEHRQQA
jgi:putative flippase GtrA